MTPAFIPRLGVQDIAAASASHTGRYLARVLERARARRNP